MKTLAEDVSGRGLFRSGGRIGLEEPRYRIGRLRTVLQPEIDALALQADYLYLCDRVVMTDHFHGTAIPGAFLLYYDEPVSRLLFGAETRHTNHQHFLFFSL